ncbi:MAG: ion channel [Actinomycetota bacterium]|nr:ion channel [Actinomycetota bacterium]MDP2287197.1 ion channel [Actinomycetota bacterium]
MEVKRRRFALFDDASPQLDRFGLLLVLVVASIVMLSLVDLYHPADALPERLVPVGATVLVGATLLLAARASGVAKRWQRIGEVAVGIGIASLAIVALFSNSSGPDLNEDSTAPVLMMLLAVLTPLVVVRRLIQHRRVSRGTMFGAISAYLLLPIAFFYLFISVNAFQSQPFFGVEQPSQVYMYFSLTSLTTLGYGDYTAQTDLGRLLSTGEAMIGQIYLVAFVAMLVGLFAAQWRESRAGDQS